MLDISAAFIVFLVMNVILWVFAATIEERAFAFKGRFASGEEIKIFLPASYNAKIPDNRNSNGLLYNLIIDPKSKYYDEMIPDGSLRISRVIFTLYNLKRSPPIPQIISVPPRDRRNDETWFQMGSSGHAPGTYVVKLEASEGACKAGTMFSSRVSCSQPRRTLSEEEIEIVDGTDYRRSAISRFLGYRSLSKSRDLIGIPDLDPRRDWMLADWRPADLDITMTDTKICTLQVYPAPLPGTIKACIELAGHFEHGDIYAPQDIEFTISGMEYESNVIPFEDAKSKALDAFGKESSEQLPRFRYRSGSAGGYWLFEMRQGGNTIAVLNTGGVCSEEEKGQPPSCIKIDYEICDEYSYRCRGRLPGSMF